MAIITRVVFMPFTLLRFRGDPFTVPPKPPTLDLVQINPATVSVITTTYFPDPEDPIQVIRAALSFDAIRSMVQAGFPVTVIDGGSDGTLFPIHDLGARVMTVDDQDMVFTRQLAAASVVDRSPFLTHMVWTEPEKDIASRIPTWIERAIAEDAAVLVPMRQHMESYPLHQQISERAGNEQLADLFSRDIGDLYFGPRVFRRDAVIRHWLRDYDEYGTEQRLWASIFSPLFSALAAGERVVGLPTDFEYPTTQTSVESNSSNMIAKRQLQRQVITQNATDLRDTLSWHPEWELKLLDGFSLQNQTMDVIDLTEQSAASL
jgi:hypothetical protein